ncbi:MAG: flippase-like domain-containing protein [Actinobacteria bacterium]|nr:flippase-like domain-containing protein [Actinomycetota bacterium]
MKKIFTRFKQFYAKHKKKISTTLRIVISIGLIAYLIFFRSGLKDFSTFKDILRTASVPLLLASASLHFVGLYISALRWQILLKTQGIRISIGFLSSSFMIGSFFNNLLPTSIGGDIFRSIDIANKAKVSVGKSASIIIIERFSGVLTAAVYGIIALLLGFTTVGTTSYIIPVVIFFVICIILAFIILNPAVLKLNRLVEKIKFLSKIRDKLKEVYHIFLNFKQFRLAIFEVMICGFAMQITVIANYYLAAKALGIDLSFAAFIFIVPIVYTIAMLPISIGGTGVRENSLVFLMVALGAAQDRSTVASLLLFAMILGFGLLGAIVYIVRPFILKQSKITETELDTQKLGKLSEVAQKEINKDSNSN